MSKIFELFGYRLDAWNTDADLNRSKAWCPFMEAECDGGGNRHLSAVNLKKNRSLASYFPKKKLVQAGICSLIMRENDQPWIVCPRRLLSLRAHCETKYQNLIKHRLANYAKLQAGHLYRVWSEVKMKVDTTTEESDTKTFDYTFDYIMAGSRSVRLVDISSLIDESETTSRRIAQKNGFTLARRNREIWVDDFPGDPIVLVEIMTSSTSGGDKNKRTQIGMAFEDAIRDPAKHQAPGINYRQVWARMVSQLIVKSQVGMAWGGLTIWVLQDLLAEYISETTALNLSKYINDHPNEVNILAAGYGEIESPDKSEPIIDLKNTKFYSGPVSGKVAPEQETGFVEIVKMGIPPPKEHLWYSLFKKAPCGIFKA